MSLLKQSVNLLSTRFKWQTGLIGGTLLLMTGRYAFNKLYSWYYALPPGPIPFIPFIGTAISQFMNADKWQKTWAMQYGQAFSIYQFNKLFVFINDSKLAKKILSKKIALDHDHNGFLDKTVGAKSFISLNGEKWSKMRRIMHTQIVRVMDTETVNKILNDVIQNGLAPELDKLTSKGNGKNLWYCREPLAELTFNIIFAANFGGNVDFKSDVLCKQLAQDLIQAAHPDTSRGRVTEARLGAFCPNSISKPIKELRLRIIKNIKILLKQRNSKSGSFIDNTQHLTEDNIDYPEEQQIADIFLMFGAGTDTTSVTTEWGLLLIARQPDIQNKVRNELMTVLERNNIDYKNDSANIQYDIKLLRQLPLFRALIHEILRISGVIRLGVAHSLAKDMDITMDDGKKYKLPKGCTIRYNVDCMHNDYLGKENWKNREFNLDFQQICLQNWIKSDNGKFYQNPSFFTFGSGKRDCVGKQLAMKELRVILGYLLLNYRFSLQPKYMKMKHIPFKGVQMIAKPQHEIPLLIEKFSQ